MTVLQLKLRAGSLECSECGASATAACNCGAPYVPKAQRAEQALKENPRMSDRAIARKIGVNQSTVSRARKTTDASASVEPRTGLDGKTRRVPKRPEPVISNTTDEINTFQRKALGFLDQFSQEFRAWCDASPVIDAEGKAALMQALYLCSDGFARLAQHFDGR